MLGEGYDEVSAMMMIEVFGMMKNSWVKRILEIIVRNFKRVLTKKCQSGILNQNLMKDLKVFINLIKSGHFSLKWHLQISSIEINPNSRSFFAPGNLLFIHCEGKLNLGLKVLIKWIKEEEKKWSWTFFYCFISFPFNPSWK